MKFLTLLCVFLSVTTGSWAQSSNCAKGPEYWCRDVSTAKDCGAVEHCQQTVWQSEQNSKKTSTTSETAQMLCNVLVHASSELLSGDSIDINSIKEYLRQDCTKLPHQHNLIQQCQMAVEIYLPDILRHITSGTELNKICSIIQGHDSSIVAIPKPKLNNLTSNQTCVLCEFIVTILKTFVSANSSSQEVTHVLEAICKEMPEVLRDECKSFVDTYGQDIIALLIREFDPEKVCILLKICHKSQNVAFLTKPNANLCGLCDYISTYLSANNPIENVCKHFSPENNLKQQCEILAHLYRPNFCSQLPLCYGDDIIQPLEQPIESPIQSAQCSLCKYVVSYIDAVIQNNKSEAAIEAALEKVCGILPPSLKAGCVTFVDSYGPLLVQLIAKYGTPELVCNALKMCHNGTETFTSLEHYAKLELEKLTLRTIPCLICKYVIGYIETATKDNKSAAAVEAALDKVCNLIPGPLKDNCTAFVHKYGPIIAFLFSKNETAQQICDFIKVCNNGTQTAMPIDKNQVSNIKPSSINSAQCSLCKYVVSYIDAVIQNNKSEAAIEAALEKVCGILPPSLKAGCVTFVDSYGPLLVQLIAKYGTPELVCNALKMCHNGTQEITPLSSGLMQMLKKKQPVINSLECSLCKYVVGYIDNIIQSNKSEAAIEAALEKVCTILPPAIKSKCDQFVVTYGPVLVQLIQKYGTPELVCNALQMCHNGTESVQPALKNVGRILKSAVQSKVASAQCSLCKYVVSYIDAVIQNNKSEAAIEAALEKVCGILPPAIKAGCVTFVDSYGPLLVQLIAKYGTPELVCNALKMCHNGTQELTSSNHIQITKLSKSTVNSAQCSLCKYVVSYIDAVIQNNKSEAAIEAALEKVCGILPPSLKAGCVTFVDSYGPLLVQLIAKYGTPELVCNALKMCHNGTQTTESISQQIVKSVKKVTNGNECTLCKYILQYINVFITSNATEQELEKALELVCSILPESYHDKCDGFVHSYGPILVELIAELDDPNVVCQWLDICPKSGKKFIQIPAVKSNKVNGLPCNLCQYAVNYLDAVLQSNTTEVKFEEALDKACKVLPKPKLQSECQTLVHLYGGDLIKFLVEYGDPKAVCQAVHLCDK